MIDPREGLEPLRRSILGENKDAYACGSVLSGLFNLLACIRQAELLAALCLEDNPLTCRRSFGTDLDDGIAGLALAYGPRLRPGRGEHVTGSLRLALEEDAKLFFEADTVSR